MPNVQTGLDVRTAEAVVQPSIKNDFDAGEMNPSVDQRQPEEERNQPTELQIDSTDRPLPSISVIEIEPGASQKDGQTRIEEPGVNEEIQMNPEVNRQENVEDRSKQNLEDNGKGMTAITSKLHGKEHNQRKQTWFIDRSIGDLVCNKAKAVKMSNITKCIPSKVSKVSHVARKIPRQLKVGVKHIKKKMQTPKRLAKYYFQRYRLFHRFDEGVVMDDVSWYSVTPEKIAKHIAERFAGRQVVVDLYSGAGGNSIQFALHGAYVIAVEISQSRIEIARNNARVYGVEEYIEFIAADVVDALRMMKERNMLVDGIFMSPPWGGPEYQESENYDVGGFKRVVDLARTVTKDVGILVPRNVSGENVLKCFGPCEMEWNYLGNKTKTVTIYFGDLISLPADCY